MGSKIQGEGDYESARRFNKQQQEFVKKKWSSRKLADQWPDTDQESNQEEQRDNDNADQDAVTVIGQDLHKNRSTK